MFEQGMKGRWMDGRGSVKDKKGTRFPKGGGGGDGWKECVLWRRRLRRLAGSLAPLYEDTSSHRGRP